MKFEPLLVYAGRETQDDVCLKQLIESFGLTCTTIGMPSLAAQLERALDHELCVLASATSVDAWCQTFSDSNAALTCLCRKAAFLFIYGFTPEVSHTFLAAALSTGKVLDIQTFKGSRLRYQVSSSHPEIAKEFSGLSFGGVRNATDFGFVCPETLAGVVPLITIEGMPLWIVLQRDGCEVFLLACNSIVDLREQVNGNIDIKTYFSRLLPAAMFLRTVFAGQCWHNKHRFANFIIDDPPLKRSYGHLNYRDLVLAMDRVGFASTIAFIPWNYKRSHAEVTQLFRDRPDRLSLCVHGCDHTGSEFASTDLALLNSRVQLASARMDTLKQQDGIAYSKIMVFPQGRFSIEALTALKSNDYLAAVNSSASPATLDRNTPLTVGDCLDPAVSKYAGFPLYLRRYPEALEQFAFDLFFGKPLLMVEHHAYLKDCGQRLTDFIANVNSLEKLQWAPLNDIITRGYLERDLSHAVAACKLSANHHIVQNKADHERTFILTKYEAGDVPIEKVVVNGQPTAFQLCGGVLEFRMRLPARSSAIVNIAYQNRLRTPSPGHTSANRARVWARRVLCEFRDTAVCWSDFIAARTQAPFHGRSRPGNLKSTQKDHVSS